MSELQAGQKLWLVESFRGASRLPQEVVIDRVGRQFFYVFIHGRSVKFDKQTMRDDFYRKCYLTEQEIQDKTEHRNLSNEITSYFRNGNWSARWSLEKLREVAKIIKEK